MPRGGARPGAGRRAKPNLPFASKAQADSVLNRLGHEYKGKQLPKEEELWLSLIAGPDQRLRFDVLKYLVDRRDGKAVQTVNHVHDKPIDLNVNVSIAEIVRKVRERKQEYERSRS